MSDFTALSEELQLYILYFVDDVDFQELARVNRLLRRLSADIVLWKHFHLVKNAAILESRLFLAQDHSRPDRAELVERNILKGVKAHQISRGVYVNGHAQIQMIETQQKIDRQMKENVVNKALKERPERSDLEKLRVVPDGVKVSSESVSPLLVQRMLKLRRAMSTKRVRMRLDRRVSVEDLAHIPMSPNSDNPSQQLPIL
ncbi:hypothetical protein MIR68_009592 [Amoeboaphelidium protococcarum]|nr:hypothetical protein MIR68_009592 [Amoeboaphelidium protococcarum]KAI3646450.1 hypothetical protein MP228_009378 [Amoeboaphelidium protococcarum]KAI3650217.1 hypothetical protein MP228_004955 [Amoeboaphelidium protococcarum]